MRRLTLAPVDPLEPSPITSTGVNHERQVQIAIEKIVANEQVHAGEEYAPVRVSVIPTHHLHTVRKLIALPRNLLPGIVREPNRLIVTNSADVPLKGLYYLLDAVAQLARKHPMKLVVIGSPKKNGGIEKKIRALDMGSVVQFTGRIGILIRTGTY